jgi:sialate O-acetylesterase
MLRYLLTLVYSILFIALHGQVETNLRLPLLFGDHMVLQQKMVLPVWGWAAPNSTITVIVANNKVVTSVGADGKWMLKLPAMDAGGPFEMKIWDKDTITINDIMIGEVWLASGQSNMEYPMNQGIGDNSAMEIAKANYPNFRFFKVDRHPYPISQETMQAGVWKLCTSSSVLDFSAVAYFFAREIIENQKVTVGIISSTWGGTPIESWMSAEMLKTHPDFEKSVECFDKDTVHWNALKKKSIQNNLYRDSIVKTAREGLSKGIHLPYYIDKRWKTAYYPMNMSSLGLPNHWGFIWFRKTFDITEVSEILDYYIQIPVVGSSYVIYMNGQPIEIQYDKATGKNSYILRGHQIILGKNIISIRLLVFWGDGSIGLNDVDARLVSLDNTVKINMKGEWRYNSEIEPAIPEKQEYYSKINVLYNGMIAPLIPYGIKGVIWYQGEANTANAFQYRVLFPMLISDWRTRWGQGNFPFLYVQIANFQNKKPEPVDDTWAELREAQLFTLSTPNTAMAVAIDVGEANSIHPKNKLDVAKRLYLAAQHVAYGKKLVYSGPLYESMKIKDSTILISFKSTGSGLITKNNKPLTGFAIAGKNKKFHWANAVIKGNQLIVSSPMVTKPVAVRYAWEINPDASLYNKEGLPASPFRTDQWKGMTEKR